MYMAAASLFSLISVQEAGYSRRELSRIDMSQELSRIDMCHRKYFAGLTVRLAAASLRIVSFAWAS